MQDKSNKLRYIFTGDIGRKIWITIGLVLIYRTLLNIPLPGFISPPNMIQQSGNGSFILVEFVDMISGGSLLKTSILGLGLLPFSIANLILQLWLPIIPAFYRRIEGDPRAGRRLLEEWKFYLAIPLGVIEALLFIGLITMNCNGQKFLTLELSSNTISKFTIVSILVAGSFFAMWIATLINELGIRGQGMSILIFSGIVGRLPNQIAELLVKPNVAINLTVYIVIFLISIVAIIYLQSGKRNIPIVYPGRRTGSRMSTPVKGNIPFILNMAGTEGFIGSQLLIAIATFYAPLATCTSVQWINALAFGTISVFSEDGPLFGPVTFLSIFIITFFYANELFLQQNIGENLKRAGAIIPGIDRSKPTQDYLLKINQHLSAVGGFILGLIAITPWLVNIITGTNLSLLDGEKMVIMVSVISDIYMNIDTEMKLHGYQDSLLI